MSCFRYFLFINLMEAFLPETSKRFLAYFFLTKIFLSVSHWYFTGIEMSKVRSNPVCFFSDDSTLHKWNLSKKLGKILRSKEYFL